MPDSWLEMAYEDRNGAVQDDYLDDFDSYEEFLMTSEEYDAHYDPND